VPSLSRAGERPAAEPAPESDDADLELIESNGTWTLRLTRPLNELNTAATVSIRVRPNLVPGIPFHAAVVITDADAH
jgi:hypothetical protein